ncbi:flagellar protein FlaG [Pseudomonas mandelii]|uniref:Flagellar protein FlaG n=1 Tax=Pseudomonas mandelii TaxID=75612 RepID=A0A502HY31_9PSED|nr:MULTISPECIES: flagellar protein FlaG [Pseudomonas]TPG78753.1 flagellar protein FlaG [Pseudomonas mandelii]TPG97144.1 flagellar protein FlaG [Pseudomonas caspiana]
MDMSVKLNLSYPAHQQATKTVADKPAHKPLAETAPVVAVKEESKGSQTEQEQLKMAVQEIEKFVQSVKRNLEFSIDEPSGKVVVKVIASDSGEVIRQIPNEEVLKLANSLNDASSLLFSAKA